VMRTEGCRAVTPRAAAHFKGPADQRVVQRVCAIYYLEREEYETIKFYGAKKLE
jgi:hypothetical protein